MQGSGLRVDDLQSEAELGSFYMPSLNYDWGKEVWGLGFRFRTLGSRRVPFRVLSSLFRVQGSLCRVHGSGCRAQSSGFWFQGAGFRFQGSGFRLQGSGFRVNIMTRGRGDSTHPA
jgi:hypothetical protein